MCACVYLLILLRVVAVLAQINQSVLLSSGFATGEKKFKVSSSIAVPEYLSAMPCGLCPVASQCTEHGIINPTSCPYMTDWLAAACSW